MPEGLTVLSHLQWWSRPTTHLLHLVQCLLVSCTFASQWPQYRVSSSLSDVLVRLLSPGSM